MPRVAQYAAALALVLCATTDGLANDATLKQPSDERLLIMHDQRTALMNCFMASVDMFDDRISPANVVADAVAWHCEADKLSDNYWPVLASRRWVPDTVDIFYRDLALPFVLKRRVQRMQQLPTATATGSR